MRSGDTGQASAGPAHILELFQEGRSLRRRLLEGKLIAFGQIVSVRDIGIARALADFGAVNRAHPLDGLFVLAFEMLRSSPDGGLFDGLIAVFLQRVNLGRKAAEHVNDLGILFGVGGQLLGSLRCFDRMIMHGTLVDVAYPGALLVSMHAAGFKPRDLARFGQPITTKVRDHIIGLARQPSVEIEVVSRKNFRQEDRVTEILKTRGNHPGLVIFSR